MILVLFAAAGTIIERKRLAGETGRTPVKAQKKNKI